MQEVRMGDYGNDRGQSRRFFASEDERHEMPMYQKAGVAAIATAGLLALGHRTGAMRKVANFLDTEGRMTHQAFKETMQEEGKLFTNMSPDRMKQAAARFKDRKKQLVHKSKLKKDDILTSRKMDMQRILEERSNWVGRVDKDTNGNPIHYEGVLPHTVEEGLRFELIMKDIRASQKLAGNKELADNIETALGKGEIGDLNFRENKHIGFLLHNQGIEDKEIVDLVNDVRNKYRKKKLLVSDQIQIKDGDELRTIQTNARQWVDGIMSKVNEMTAKEMQGATRKNGAIRETIIGHKQATVGDILRLSKEKRIQLDPSTKAKIDDVKSYNKNFDDAVWDENLYIDNRTGDVFDYKVFDKMKRSQMEWWSHTIPGGLLHLRDILNVKTAREQATFRVMKRQTVQASLNANQGIANTAPLTQEVLYINGKMVKLFDPKAIDGSDAALKILNPDRDMYLTSSRYGTGAKIHRHASGLMTTGKKTTILGEEKDRNRIERLLDLRGQDKDAGLVENFSIFTKWLDPKWERNKINNFINNGVQNTEDYYDLQRYLNKYTVGFNDRTLNNLMDELPQGEKSIKKFIVDNDIKLSREEDTLKLFEFMGEHGSRSSNYDLHSLYQKYKQNPNEMLLKSSPIGESNPLIGGVVRVQTGLDSIKQSMSIELMRQMIERKKISGIGIEEAQLNFSNLVEDLWKKGDLRTPDKENVDQLMNNYMFQMAGRNMYRGSETSMESVNNLFTGDSPIAKRFQQSMSDMTKKINPWYEPFSNIKPVNQVEDEFILVNKAFNSTTFEGRAKEFFTDFSDKMLQMSPFTGRRNMEDFTSLSMIGYYLPYRLQDALGSWGLGLSDASMGNSAQIWSSLMLKRVLPTFGAISGLQYADYTADQIYGQSFTEGYQNMIADRRLSEASAREEMGNIEQLKRARLLKPGIEHFEAFPSVELPVLGEVGLGKLASAVTGALTFGNFGAFEKDTMTYEETATDILEGTEEVRKGRWWAFGSTTAYRGDRVIEFAPNSYRLAHSDYQYTDTLYGDGENWKNSFFPTFENPLGALGYLLGTADPYWFEKKHYHDRPYLLTGELFNANTPFIGDIGNMTLGSILKPVKQMNMEYWGDPVAVQEEANQLSPRPVDPVITRISPGGRMDFRVPASTEGYGAPIAASPTYNEGVANSPDVQARLEAEKEPYAEEGNYPKQYVMIPGIDEQGNRTNNDIIHDTETGDTIYVPTRLHGQYENYDHAFAAARANSTGQEKYVDTRPRKLTATEYAYQENVDKRKLEELVDPRSIKWRAQELGLNWMEPHGVYNWILLDEVMRNEPYAGKMVIQRADAASNASKNFWEQELGSLGGAVTEIGRRFIRRDSGQLDKYNPVENTMPSWLPGGEYFINFQTGDPYSKIPHGDYRLPGEAYESLNKLHSDETGRYGAFDKFKILADVAPWSDEYKFWRDYVVKYQEDPELRKQAAQIKKQVAKRKAKYEFQEYIFKDAHIEKEKVTVKRFLDDHTFLTEEYGDTPVRLAGVDVRKKAPGVLEQYIKEGDKITIGVDADPDKRISNDTYGTMRAVVFKGLKSINQEIIARGDMKEAENDTSPVGVWARFKPGEIRKGARWESIAHHDSSLNTKFLQVRTALEDYERDQIYGKDWATWENFGVTDYLLPSIGEMRGELGASGMVAATTSGMFVGGFIGRILLGGGANTKYSALLGATVGFTANVIGQTERAITGERWIPKRRKIEHEINEYFDVLKYMKFSGLYEKAKIELSHAGYDVEQLFEDLEQREQETKQRRRDLNNEKKSLYVQRPNGWEERRSEINLELQQISEQFQELRLPPAVVQAMQYKEERDTTLYAIDPYADRMKVMQAMPYKDKWYFNEFADASKEEQARIIELVPENQRRIYKALWGGELEPQKPLEYYAQKYDIPDADWEGWSPDYSLEDIKVKVVKSEGLALSDFNYWNDDIEASQFVPSINESNDYHQPPSLFKGYSDVESNIRAVMEGQGLRNVRVTVQPGNSSETYVSVNYEQDRSQEIEDEFKYNMQRYV